MTTPTPSKPGPKPARVSSEELLRLGKLGRFRLLDKLGEGAMGSVLLAEDITLKRRCALKLLPCVTDTAEQRMFLEQFVREARSAAALVHHAIVQIFQVGVAQGYAYIAMELLDGPNLDEHVKAHGPMPIAQACSLIAEAAEGLGYAHEQGIWHRDIKPANLVITSRGRCKVCDFGVAQISDPDDTFKLPYNVVGTPYYLSPEAARGQSSPNADLWALAGSLWFVLTGKPPFAIQSPADARRVHVELPLPDIRQLRPDIPEGLAHLLERALALEINRRYHSGDELAEALRPFTVTGDGLPVAAPVVPEPAPRLIPVASSERAGRTAVGGRRRRRKNTVPLLVGGAFALVLLLVIGGVVAAMLIGRGPIPALVATNDDTAAMSEPEPLPTPPEPLSDIASSPQNNMPDGLASPAPRDPLPTLDTRPEPVAYQPSAEVFAKPEPTGPPPDPYADLPAEGSLIDAYDIELLSRIVSANYAARDSGQDVRTYRVQGRVNRVSNGNGQMATMGTGNKVQGGEGDFYFVVKNELIKPFNEAFGKRGPNDKNMILSYNNTSWVISGKVWKGRFGPYIYIDDVAQATLMTEQGKPIEPDPRTATGPEPAKPAPPASSGSAAQQPIALDVSDRAAVAAAVADQLGERFEVTAAVDKAGRYRGDWHLILQGGHGMRVVIPGDAAEAVSTKLGRPIKVLETLTIKAIGPLETLEGQANRPLIRVSDAEQISLPESP